MAPRYSLASVDFSPRNSAINLPEPLELIVEAPEHGKSLALWRIEDLITPFVKNASAQ